MRQLLKIITFSFLLIKSSYAQDSLHVLFLGNSYTYYNNLPLLVQELSKAVGKTLIVDSYTPGGYTLDGHSTDATALNKIRQGLWDYVVLQEQSQIPTIDYYKTNEMYPAALRLKDSIELYNPCAKIITYMTWGRRYGGQQCDQNAVHCSPAFTDFNHMQDSITSAYIGMSNLLKACCAPVGVAWKNILSDSNFVLHIADNSHPEIEGSYIAACVLYSAIWKQKSIGLTYTAGLPATTANYFQQWCDSTVYKSSNDWNMNIDQLKADFVYNRSNVKYFIKYTNTTSSKKPFQCVWDFGDGTTSSDTNPEHIYASSGKYFVKLKVTHCKYVDSFAYFINVENPLGIVEKTEYNTLNIYPNPANEMVSIEMNEFQPTTIFLYDMSGKLIIQKALTKTIDKIDISNLTSGLYIVELRSNLNINKVKLQVY
ncbi:MAG: T9SS type A sorting domain-containing protein [Bacteroidetes bacterium]|nr:T9SS type A sorting domain-containing protein [Bacteroidota bacterium]